MQLLCVAWKVNVQQYTIPLHWTSVNSVLLDDIFVHIYYFIAREFFRLLMTEIESNGQRTATRNIFVYIYYFIAREFFRLLMTEIESNAALMCGMEGQRTAVHNTVALDKREFRTVGQYIHLWGNRTSLL